MSPFIWHVPLLSRQQNLQPNTACRLQAPQKTVGKLTIRRHDVTLRHRRLRNRFAT